MQATGGAASSASAPDAAAGPRRRLFLDVDGVLADFVAGVGRVCGGRTPDDMKPRDMWPRLACAHPPFFESLDFMPDAPTLLAFTMRFKPTLLSGIPHGNWAPKQKQAWVAAKLGRHVPLITCLAREKGRYASPGDVLVDDTPANAASWEAAGGVFVLHTDAVSTIAKLIALGFPPQDEDGSGGGAGGGRFIGVADAVAGGSDGCGGSGGAATAGGVGSGSGGVAVGHGSAHATATTRGAGSGGGAC